MMIQNPVVIRTAMLMEELEEGALRAAYMVVSQMHELQMRGVPSQSALTADSSPMGGAEPSQSAKPTALP